MFGGQVDALTIQENAGPLGLGLVEQVIDLLLELAGSRAADAELQVSLLLAALGSLRFVVELGVDELEDFLEGVHASVG